MSKFWKTLFLTATATGVAALLLNQLDFDAARPDPNAGFPDPDDFAEEDVENLLNELASHL